MLFLITFEMYSISVFKCNVNQELITLTKSQEDEFFKSVNSDENSVVIVAT